jgi:hypothetical protein
MANYADKSYADKRKKKLKTSKADSGAQLFMSDEAKEQMLNRPFEGSEIENLIDRALTERMLEGKITPKKSGRTQAYTYGDMIGRAIDDKPKVAKKKYGGKVAKMKYGGMVEGYEYGGEVGGSCRGGGAAVSGTKFSGVK